jgi:hypothetical protein
VYHRKMILQWEIKRENAQSVIIAQQISMNAQSQSTVGPAGMLSCLIMSMSRESLQLQRIGRSHLQGQESLINLCTRLHTGLKALMKGKEAEFRKKRNEVVSVVRVFCGYLGVCAGAGAGAGARWVWVWV